MYKIGELREKLAVSALSNTYLPHDLMDANIEVVDALQKKTIDKTPLKYLGTLLCSLNSS